MSNLSNWLKAFDEQRELQQPFKKHLVAELLNEHEQNIYAVLHAAFILFNGSITQNQERLYRFWLPSISEDLKLSEVINQAQEFDGEKLKEAIALIETQALFEMILLDVLVFTRLDGGLSDELKQILNEWCQLLHIQQEAIEDVLLISEHILGVEDAKQPKLTSIIENLLNNQVWSEFYIRKLNKSNVNNVTGGFWCVEEDIVDVAGDILFSDAVFVFYNNSKITCYDGELKFNNLVLINPIFDITSVDIFFDNVIVKGLYDEMDNVTAFSIKGQSINGPRESNVRNCQFETNNARVFCFDDPMTNGCFDKVKFSFSGNNKLLGGAIKYEKGLKFTECEFEKCHAKVGGAVFLKQLTGSSFERCRFINCTSKIEWSEGDNAGCLYSESEENKNNIINSFISNNISIYRVLSSNNDNCSLIEKSIIKGCCLYSEYCDSAGNDYSYILDSESVTINAVNGKQSKNKCVSVSFWRNLISEDGQ